MTEKEFILSVFENIWPDAVLPEMMDEINDRIDGFLDYHHKYYFEVEFIKRVYEGEVDWEKVHPIECANMRRSEYKEGDITGEELAKEMENIGDSFK